MPRNQGDQAAGGRSGFGHALRRIVLALLAFLVVAGALFAWNRWFRFDDAADLQGVWVDESGAQLALDGQRMLLGDAVVYDYQVDTATKTLTYEFNGTTGHSAYRFSGDRSILAVRDVEEGGGTDWLMVLHLRPDPLLATLDLASEVPEGCSRLQRSTDSVAKAFEAYEARPTGVQEVEAQGIAWPEDMVSSKKDDESGQEAQDAQGAQGVQETQDVPQEQAAPGNDGVAQPAVANGWDEGQTQ